MMRSIIWLASYPKSGNTWLRAFLANYLANGPTPVDINSLSGLGQGDAGGDLFQRVTGRPLSDLTDADIHRARPQVHALLAASCSDGVGLAKTHSALVVVDGTPSITPEVTAGAIYIVRNPLDVVVSWAGHFACSIDAAIEAVASPTTMLSTDARRAAQIIGRWSDHVSGWTSAGFGTLVLRYEDMQSNPAVTFARVLEHLRQPFDRARLDRALTHSRFCELARQEERRGFIERPSRADRFFRVGRAGGWRKILTARQAERVMEEHEAVMTEYGYLDQR